MDGSGIVIDPHLPRTDIIALENLIGDIREARAAVATDDDVPGAAAAESGSALTADGAGETTTTARSGSPNSSSRGLLADDDLEAVASGRATPHEGNAATGRRSRRSSPSSASHAAKQQLPKHGRSHFFLAGIISRRLLGFLGSIRTA